MHYQRWLKNPDSVACVGIPRDPVRKRWECPTEKPCSRCREVKSVADFDKQSRLRDGQTAYQSWCKSCRNAINYERFWAKKGREERARHEEVPVLRAQGLKRCTICGVVKEEGQFYTGGTSTCKSCHYLKDLSKKYDISLVDARALLSSSDGRCESCGVEAQLCVDHDHATGAIRGLVCGPCNIMLGHAGDDPNRLLAGALYLERHASVPTPTVPMEIGTETESHAHPGS